MENCKRSATRSAKGKKRYLLPLDIELFREIERLAQQECRSIAGQIEYLLKKALSFQE